MPPRCEVSYALAEPSHTKVQLEQSIERDKHPGRYRNGRKYQHDRPVRMGETERKQATALAGRRRF